MTKVWKIWEEHHNYSAQYVLEAIDLKLPWHLSFINIHHLSEFRSSISLVHHYLSAS